jgi:uncharacterized protein (TIGR03435 family)
MSQKIFATALIALGSLILRAQPPREFEAATIKPVKNQTQSFMRGGPGSDDPSQIRYVNVTLTDVIEEAYGVKRYQIRDGKPWFDSERWEILARVPKGATKDDLKVMLQRLLADRFKLVQHSETKQLPNYRLVVDKGGPKLKSPEPQDKPKPGAMVVGEDGSIAIPSGALGRPVSVAGKHLMTLMSASQVSIIANSQPVSELVKAFTNHAGRPVLDATGLSGLYDFSLHFAATSETQKALFTNAPAGDCLTCSADDEPPPDLLTAVKEQLGLRLDPGIGPLNLLVIERIERTPTEN